VAFVYDKEDTEGDPLPEDVEQTFHAVGSVTKATIGGFVHHLANRGIGLVQIPFGDGKAGYLKAIRRSDKPEVRPEYHVRLNAEHEPNVQFATLVHELAHLYLGHLGPDKFLKIASRPPLPHDQEELEAESLAFLVCSRHGVKSKSESYLKDHVKSDTTVEKLDIYMLLKAAGQIETALNIAAHTLFGPKVRGKSAAA
jgi:hypothetical protein